MGGFMDSLFGGSQTHVDWKQLERLMDMSLKAGRYDDVGIFSGTKWTEGPNGKWTRERTLAPGMEQGLSRLMGRASGGMGMGMPQGMHQLMGAAMQNQADRRGMPMTPYQPPPPPMQGPPPEYQPPPGGPSQGRPPQGSYPPGIPGGGFNPGHGQMQR